MGLLAAVSFVAPTARAAVTEAWVQRYNGQAKAVAVDGSGNVVVTGSSATIKYGAIGTGIWTNNGGGHVLAVDDSGNVVVTGGYTTIKYRANGTEIWTNNGGTALAVDGTGNVVVAGSSYNGTNNDYYTAKYAAADGALLWEKRYNGPANRGDITHAVAVDGSGNVVVTGYSYNGTNYDYYTAKYAAANGALLWEKRHSGPPISQDDEDFHAMAVDGSGNVVVTGYSDGAPNFGYFTAKYAAANGALLWEKRFDGTDNYNGEAHAVAVDGSGDVIVTGYAGPFPNKLFYTAKYAAADGALLWERIHNTPFGIGIAEAVAVDGSGNVVVAGNSYDGTNYDYYTAKYAAADGALLWEKLHNSNGYDVSFTSRSLAIGANGTVVLAVSSVTILYREILPPISITQVPIGIRLRFAGVAGQSYHVLRAPAVTGPWSTNATLTAITNGILEHIDTNAPPGSAFYRTAVGP